METYQVITFKFRETLELKMGNPEPNPVFWKQTRVQKAIKKKKDRCRDSMEAVLTNGVGCGALVKESLQKGWRINLYMYTYWNTIFKRLMTTQIRISFNFHEKLKNCCESIISWKKNQIFIDQIIYYIKILHKNLIDLLTNWLIGRE